MQPGVAACRGDRLHSGELEMGGKSTAGPLSPVPGVFSHLIRLEFLLQGFFFLFLSFELRSVQVGTLTGVCVWMGCGDMRLNG